MSNRTPISRPINQAGILGALLLLASLLSACGDKPTPTVPPATNRAAVGSEDTAQSSAQLAIVNFGPRSTPVDTPFNVQRDGNSGISFELSRPAPPPEVSGWFDNKPLTGVVARDRVVTATIPREYLATPGEYLLELEVGGARLPAGSFEVTPR